MSVAKGKRWPQSVTSSPRTRSHKEAANDTRTIIANAGDQPEFISAARYHHPLEGGARDGNRDRHPTPSSPRTGHLKKDGPGRWHRHPHERGARDGNRERQPTPSSPRTGHLKKTWTRPLAPSSPRTRGSRGNSKQPIRRNFDVPSYPVANHARLALTSKLSRSHSPSALFTDGISSLAKSSRLFTQESLIVPVVAHHH